MCASPTPSPTESLQAQHTLPEPARGRGMTRRADRYFIQETLRNINLQDGPPCPGTLMRESHPATPEAGQYDSPDVDDPEEDLTSQADLTVRMNTQMQRATLDNPCQPNETTGGTMPCVERGHA